MATFPPPQDSQPLAERITEARAIALDHRAQGNLTMADFWDANVDRLLDRLPRRKAASDADRIPR